MNKRNIKKINKLINGKTPYDLMVQGIVTVLYNKYNLCSKDAQDAVKNSPLKDIFDKYESLALHNSANYWADKVYEYWESNKV